MGRSFLKSNVCHRQSCTPHLRNVRRGFLPLRLHASVVEHKTPLSSHEDDETSKKGPLDIDVRARQLQDLLILDKDLTPRPLADS